MITKDNSIRFHLYAQDVAKSAYLVYWVADNDFHVRETMEYLRKALDAIGYDLVEKPKSNDFDASAPGYVAGLSKQVMK